MRVARVHVEKFVRLQAANLKYLWDWHRTIVFPKPKSLLDGPARAIHRNSHAQGAPHVQRLAGRRRHVRKHGFTVHEANGELLKLGIKISQATVGRWMPWRPKVPFPTWRSFLRNHLPDIVAIDMFVVATATFAALRLDRVKS